MLDNLPASARLSVVALLCIAVSLVVGAAVGIRAGVLMLGALSALAAALRAFTPERGSVVVRRRLVDVTVLVLFAVALSYLGATAQLD